MALLLRETPEISCHITSADDAPQFLAVTSFMRKYSIDGKIYYVPPLSTVCHSRSPAKCLSLSGAQLPRRQMSRSRAITRRGEAKHRRVGGNPGSCLRPPVQPYPEMTTAAWLRPSDRAFPSHAASFDERGRRHTFDRSATSQSHQFRSRWPLSDSSSCGARVTVAHLCVSSAVTLVTGGLAPS